MKTLIIGGGAREHALAWKVAQSDKASEIYCAPGNGGIKPLATCVDIPADDIDSLLAFALKKEIDLTIVGPEAPLVAGIADRFQEKGLAIFGPNQKAAQLEGSKLFAKKFMQKYGIPTARYESFDTCDTALAQVRDFKLPLVVKADGLAAGKGVVICKDYPEAENTLKEMMLNQKFGEAGTCVIIEEYLDGTEASLLCLVAGDHIIPMESARDYKKIMDGDKGLNTGGMGCFSPNSIFSEALQKNVQEEILAPIMTGLREEAIDFRGVLFIGLMITKTGPKVLEFNVRFGDPETEVVLPRLTSDIITIFQKTIAGSLQASDLHWSDQKSVCVVIASGGYPGKYEKGKEITGLQQVPEDIIVFHAGTKEEEGVLYTNGGRVLAVTALDSSLASARDSVYKSIKNIHFGDMYFRHDIAL